jgi:agmatine deiminase
MIADSETNFLYLADTLPKKYSNFYDRFKNVLNDCDIESKFLSETKDVWAVDFMPIQVGVNEFIRFLYRPPYLTKSKKWAKTISDVDGICKDIGIETAKISIILDGGNVVRTKNKVIITDRVFIDNPNYDRRQLTRELYELLQIDELFFIPEQPGDFTGHADGMVRFLDENTVIINDFKKEKSDFYRAFEIAIHNTGLNRVRIPYNVYDNKSNDQANGDYINYLQMDNLVIVPTFRLKEDDEVIRQFEDLFSGQRIETVESNEIAKNGGVLNCITWNIKTDM